MTPVDSSDAELEAFDQVCRRLGGFNPRVATEWADGYLTALHAGPRALAIEEWLPRLGGDAFERAFADPDDAAQASQALQARVRVLARQLDPESLLDKPEALHLQPLVSLWDEAARAEIVKDLGATDDEAAEASSTRWTTSPTTGACPLTPPTTPSAPSTTCCCRCRCCSWTMPTTPSRPTSSAGGRTS